MKKLILTGLFAIGLAFASHARTVSVSIPPGGITNILNTSVAVQQIILSAPTATNTSVTLVDSPTNVTTFVQLGFTNTLSYATNIVNSYTNFWGTLTQVTNFNALVDVPVAVPQTTNAYPVRIGNAAALASTSTKFDNVNYYFNSGVTITNTSSGNATVSITYTGPQR